MRKIIVQTRWQLPVLIKPTNQVRIIEGIHMAKKYNKAFDNTLALSSRKLQEITRFYLFQCPVDGISFRAQTFKEHGWYGQVQFAQLKRKMLEAASSSLIHHYYPCTKNELKTAFYSVDQVAPLDEYCVFLKNEERTVMQSLFSAIRNAFAHGSFSVREYKLDGKKVSLYFFSNCKNYLKAEIVLQENTLLDWIKIIKTGYLA